MSAKKIKLGVLGPLCTNGGIGMMRGALMAAEDLNEQGGILGRELEVVTCDDSIHGISVPFKCVSGFIKLVQDDKVNLVVGPYSSHCALEILDLLQKYKTLVITSGAVADTIDHRIAANPEKYKYFFRTMISASSQALNFWEYFRETIIKKFNVEKIAVFYEKLVWTNAHLTVFKKMAEKDGVQISHFAAINVVKPSFTLHLKKVKDKGVQSIIEVFSLIDTSDLVCKWADMKIPAILTGGDVTAMDSYFWERTGGKCFSQIVAHYGFRTPITPKTIDFYDRYVVKFGCQPNFQSFFAYDSVMIWAFAVKEAGTVQPEKVYNKLLEITYEGVAGRFEFDPISHSARAGPDLINGIYVQWQSNGERIPVWPKTLCPKGRTVVLPPHIKFFK